MRVKPFLAVVFMIVIGGRESSFLALGILETGAGPLLLGPRAYLVGQLDYYFPRWPK